MSFRSNTIKLFIALSLCASLVGAQEPVQTDENLNFGYSQNPAAQSLKTDVRNEASGTEKSQDIQTKYLNIGISKTPADDPKPKFESVAKMMREVAKEESVKNLKPTEYYKVGAGDVLLVSLEDSKSNYYTVLNDGSIDYPLAGGLIPVSGLTVAGIEELLRSRVLLYENPDVTVRVREYASHAIDVLGMVEKSGKHYLQREAIPLFVIRAQSLAESDGDIAIIKRPNAEEMTFTVGTAEFDAALVYTGDVVEFASSASRAAKNGFVFVGGNVGNVGRVGFLKGITLTQAIVAAGGVTDERADKVFVRRKNDKGFLESKTYKLKDIKKGKTIDPVLEIGDLIEVET